MSITANKTTGHGAATRRYAWVVLAAWVHSSLVLGPVEAPGVPACPDPFTIRQPGGQALAARLHGDEFFNWVTTSDGLVIRSDDEGHWRYVTAKGTVTALSSSRAGIDPPPGTAVKFGDVPRLQSALAAMTEPVGRGITARDVDVQVRAPSGPTEPMLVLLVQFTDQTLTTSEAQWATAMFGASGKTVRTYYDEASRNGFHFTAASESYGTSGNGIVVVTLGYAHPDPGQSIGDSNRQMVKDALIAADPFVDFSTFDTDSSGGLSRNELHVVTVIAGYEEAYSSSYSPSVWGHRWSLYSPVSEPQLDGVYVAALLDNGGYTQQGENHGTHMATIGILCHELGHSISLPDLYDTVSGNGDSEGIGGHGLMGSGSWGRTSGEDSGATPTLMCAWSRIEMGFESPTTAASGTHTVYEASDTSNGNILKFATSDANQYFLVENRQLTGFDAGLYRWFGSGLGGLAIWHVDDSVTTDNDDETHKMVDLEEANEGILGYSELDTETNRGSRLHYYYAGHVTAFHDSTTPSARLYDGSASGIAISDVSTPGATMTFSTGDLPVDHFDWSAITSPKYVGSPFAVTVTARDATDNTVTSFTDSVGISGWLNTGEVSSIVITECFEGDPDYVEIQNVSRARIDATGWVVALNDAVASDINDVHTNMWSLGSIASGDVQYRTDNANDNYWGDNIWWGSLTERGWAMVVDDNGDVVDFVVWGYSNAEIIGMSVTVNEHSITIGSEWSGKGVTYGGDVSSLQRTGSADNNDRNDLSWASTSKGTQNTGLAVPYGEPPAPVSITPTTTASFVQGVWPATVTVLALASNMFLTADDGDGHAGSSVMFDVGASSFSLAVTSSYAVADPPPGSHTYDAAASVTCAVTGSPVQVEHSDGMIVSVCTGWVGSGSVPASGLDTNVTFTIGSDSSITWQWALSDVVMSNQVVSGTISTQALHTITARDSYRVAPSADATFTAGDSIRLSDGFRAESGSVFRATIDAGL